VAAAEDGVSHWQKHFHGVLELVVSACSDITCHSKPVSISNLRFRFTILVSLTHSQAHDKAAETGYLTGDRTFVVCGCRVRLLALMSKRVTLQFPLYHTGVLHMRIHRDELTAKPLR